MPSLRRLEYLLAIADNRSFRQAADAVNVTQPTLSQQFKLLETDLGVTLIDRGLTSNELTPIGRDVLERARRIITEVNDLKHACRMAKGGTDTGVLHFGVSPTIGPYIMPEIVSNLYKEKPGLRVYIREGIPDEQFELLCDGKIDLLLTPLPVRGNGLHIEPLFREPLQIIASSNHQLAKQQHIALSDLENYGLLNFDPRHHLSHKVSEICESLKMRPLHDYEGTSLDSIYQMVASDLGLAVLPELYLKSSAGAIGGVSVLNVSHLSLYRDIVLVWRKEAPFRELGLVLAKLIRHHGTKINMNQISGL